MQVTAALEENVQERFTKRDAGFRNGTSVSRSKRVVTEAALSCSLLPQSHRALLRGYCGQAGPWWACRAFKTVYRHIGIELCFSISAKNSAKEFA